MEKYELTNETKQVYGKTVYRIRALKDFNTVWSNVNKGDLGGFVESTENLDQSGYCWIHDNAVVLDNAKVISNATLRDNSSACGDSLISGHAEISGYAHIRNLAGVSEKAHITGGVLVSGNAQVTGHAYADGSAHIGGEAFVDGYSRITGDMVILHEVTKTPIYLTGFEWHVLIMDKHMTIGCKTFAFEKWYKFSDDEILKIGGFKALKMWKKYKKTLLNLACEGR